jgi:hypothetical protein
VRTVASMQLIAIPRPAVPSPLIATRGCAATFLQVKREPVALAAPRLLWLCRT